MWPRCRTELNGLTPGTQYDQVGVSGTVTLGGTLVATLGFVPSPGAQFVLINNDGSDAVSGTFSGLSEGAGLQINGIDMTISYVGSTGNDVVLTVATPTPMMGPIGLFLLGLVLLLMTARLLRRERVRFAS